MTVCGVPYVSICRAHHLETIDKMERLNGEMRDIEKRAETALMGRSKKRKLFQAGISNWSSGGRII